MTTDVVYNPEYSRIRFEAPDGSGDASRHAPPLLLLASRTSHSSGSLGPRPREGATYPESTEATATLLGAPRGLSTKEVVPHEPIAGQRRNRTCATVHIVTKWSFDWLSTEPKIMKDSFYYVLD